jgi:hypothetical protein
LPGVDLLRFAAKPNKLAQKITLRALIKLGLADFEGHCARKASNAECVANAKPFADLRVDVDARALPEAKTQERVYLEVFGNMGKRRKTVRPE